MSSFLGNPWNLSPCGITHSLFRAFRFRQSLPLQILIADCCRIPFPSFKIYITVLCIRFSCICWNKSLQIHSMTFLTVFRHSLYVDHSDCGSNNSVFILIQSFYLAVQSWIDSYSTYGFIGMLFSPLKFPSQVNRLITDIKPFFRWVAILKISKLPWQAHTPYRVCRSWQTARSQVRHSAQETTWFYKAIWIYLVCIWW